MDLARLRIRQLLESRQITRRSARSDSGLTYDIGVHRVALQRCCSRCEPNATSEQQKPIFSAVRVTSLFGAESYVGSRKVAPLVAQRHREAILTGAAASTRCTQPTPPPCAFTFILRGELLAEEASSGNLQPFPSGHARIRKPFG